MDEWISCDERLPPPGLAVLVYAPPHRLNAFESFPFGIMAMSTGPWPPIWPYTGFSKITHWMELPEFPDQNLGNDK